MPPPRPRFLAIRAGGAFFLGIWPGKAPNPAAGGRSSDHRPHRFAELARDVDGDVAAVRNDLAAVHEHISHICRGRCEHHRVERVLHRAARKLHPVERDGDEVGAAPGSIRPASGQPRQACPCSVAARISDSVVWIPRRPLASRSSSSIARASSKRSMNGVRVRAERERRAGAGEPAHRPIPSARSRSVVGQAQQHAPASPSKPHVGLVEVRRVYGREARVERAGVGEQGGRRPRRRRRGTPRSRPVAQRRARAAGSHARVPTPPPPWRRPGRPRACCGSPRRSSRCRCREGSRPAPPTRPRFRRRSASARPRRALRFRRGGSRRRSASAGSRRPRRPPSARGPSRSGRRTGCRPARGAGSGTRRRS